MESKADRIKNSDGSKDIYKFTCEIEPGITVICHINEDVSLGLYIQSITPDTWRQDTCLDLNDIYDMVCPEIMNFILEFKSDLYFNMAVKKYAEETLKVHEALEKGIVKHNFNSFQFNIGWYDSVILEPYVYCENPTLNDIEYIMPHDNDLSGSESLWKMASSLTPSVYAKTKNISKEIHDQLMNVYIKELLPIEFISYDGLTPEQEQTLSKRYQDINFSDWHKDVYGFRPRCNDNQCLKEFMARGKMEREYVEFVKGWNANGKECPTGFEDYIEEEKMIREDQEIERE